jgi:hypothetical protein
MMRSGSWLEYEDGSGKCALGLGGIGRVCVGSMTGLVCLSNLLNVAAMILTILVDLNKNSVSALAKIVKHSLYTSQFHTEQEIYLGMHC